MTISQFVPIATAIGVLAAVVQFLGLARWPFLVPALARSYVDPASSEARREAIVVVFESFHRYLGVAVGECLGYLFTGVWTVLVGVGDAPVILFEAWLAGPGIAIGLLLLAGSLEFVGRFEEKGWKLAGMIVPIAYTAWSLGLSPPGSCFSSAEKGRVCRHRAWSSGRTTGALAESYATMLVMLSALGEEEVEAPEAVVGYAIRRAYASAFLRQAETFLGALGRSYLDALIYYFGLRSAAPES